MGLGVSLLFCQCKNAETLHPPFQIYAIRLHPGQDVLLELKNFISEKNISAGFILSAVGSLTQYNIRFANQQEGKQETGHFEVVSLTGLLSVKGSHIHISVSDSVGHTIGGHLLGNNLVFTTLELVIGEDQGHIFDRETDATFGYKELVVKEKNGL